MNFCSCKKDFSLVFVLSIFLFIFFIIFAIPVSAETISGGDSNLEFKIITSEGYLADSTEVLITADVLDAVSAEINITDVTFRIAIPSGVSFSGVHSEIGTISPVVFEDGLSYLKWTIGTLQKNENLKISFFVRANSSSSYIGGVGSDVSYSINSENPKSLVVPEIELIAEEYIPEFYDVSYFQGKSCSVILDMTTPVREEGCIKAKIRDDNLDLDSVFIRSSQTITNSNVKGSCTQLTFSQKPYTYECKFPRINYDIISAGDFSTLFIASDNDANQGSYTDVAFFEQGTCDIDIAIRMAGAPEHYVEARLIDANGNVILFDTFVRGSGSPKINHLVVEDILAGRNLILDLRGFSYDANGGNPLWLMINGRKVSNLIFNHNENGYVMTASLFDLTNSQDLCEEYTCNPSGEVCDGTDNDCDGLIDEYQSSTIEGGICGDCNLGDARYCDAYLLGECSGGLQLCVEDSKTSIPKWSQCESMVEPSFETGENSCDGLDNDCDGLIDEDSACSNDVCSDGQTRPCSCNCDSAKVLMVLDDNNHGEDVDDFYQIYDELIELGINVVQIKEEELGGRRGFSYDDIKDYDLVWFSNPGYPPDDQLSLEALKKYYELGNPIVIQGDDMTQFATNPDLLWSLTGFQNPSPYDHKFNGIDADHTVTFSKGSHLLLAGLSGRKFTYVGDDIDITIADGDAQVLATAVSEAWRSFEKKYSPIPVISFFDEGYVDETRSARFVKLTTLLTFSKIEPASVRKVFTGNIVNYLLNLGGKCDCGPANPPECGIAVQTCLNGKWGLCEGIPKLAVEVCNKKDDNCNGQIDEGLNCECNVNDPKIPCGPEVEVEGICSFGTIDCVNNGNSFVLDDTCDAVYTDLYVEHEYGNSGGYCTLNDCGVCMDGLDNDCDGLTDSEDPDCPCFDTDSDGVCDNVDTCKEIPNGPDKGICILDLTSINSVEGLIDPVEFGITTSDTYKEVCYAQDDCSSNEICSLSQESTACQCIPVKEFCNGLDDDCDGVPDDGITCDCDFGGQMTPCGKDQAYCYSECIDTGDGSFVNGECMNMEYEENPFTITTDICGNGIDEDCDGKDAVCPTCSEIFVNSMLPADSPNSYTGDIAYYMPEKPTPSYSVEPSDNLIIAASDYSLPYINFEFEIKKIMDYPGVTFDVKLDRCEINDDENIFLEYYKRPTLNDLLVSCPLDILSSDPNSCFVNNRIYGNLLTLSPTTSDTADVLLNRIISEVGNFSLKCYIDIETVLETSQGSEECGKSTHVLELTADSINENVCDERLCLIKEELHDEFWMGRGMEVIETINDVITVGSTICNVIPTTASLMEQIGDTLSSVGALLMSGPWAAYTYSAGCGVWTAGSSVKGAGGTFRDYVWYNKINGNFPSVNFWCDVFFGCTLQTMVEDSNFIGFLTGDFSLENLSTQANDDDSVKQTTENGYFNFVDDFQDGFAVTDFLQDGANAGGDWLQTTVNSTREGFKQSCDDDAECPSSKYCNLNTHKCDSVFPENPGTPEQLFSQSIGSDNLIFSIMTLCPRDIVRNILSYREIHCTYVECLMTPQSTSSCVIGRNDAFCRKVYGTIFELFGPFRLMSAIKAWLQNVVANFPSMVLTAAYGELCDALNLKFYSAPASPDQCSVLSASLAHLLVCRLPETIYTSIDTYHNVENYIKGMIEFIETASQGGDAFGLQSTCDMVIEKEDEIDTLLSDCSCADVNAATWTIGDTTWVWN